MGPARVEKCHNQMLAISTHLAILWPCGGLQKLPLSLSRIVLSMRTMKLNSLHTHSHCNCISLLGSWKLKTHWTSHRFYFCFLSINWIFIFSSGVFGINNRFLIESSWEKHIRNIKIQWKVKVIAIGWYIFMCYHLFPKIVMAFF